MKISQIIAMFKSLFKKDENITSDLSCPESTIKIPSRKVFNNDALIDLYKEEYLNALNNMRGFDCLVLEANSLNEHVKMVSDLLFAIAICEDDINASQEKSQLKHLVNYEKLKLYFQDLLALQNEVVARIIALLEIRRELLIISRRKKDVINNVTNRLYISLNTLLASQMGIINDMKNHISNTAPIDDEVKKEAKQKADHLNWLQMILPQNKQVTISQVDEDKVFFNLALVEKAIEEYTYTHKDEVSSKVKQQAIDNILAASFDMEHKEDLLREIGKLELKYRAFYEYRLSPIYGEIPVDETDLSLLYSIKFNALLINEKSIINPEFLNLNAIDPMEYEYYQNLIYKTYEDIIMGRNEIFNKLFKDDFEKAINLIKEIFKNKLSNVLYDYLLINLLFAFDSEKGLYNFFKSKISSFILPKGLYDHAPIELTDNIPLETLCYIESAVDESEENKDLHFEFTRKPLYELYLIYLNNYPEQDDVYRMPEGITNIKISKAWDKFSTAELALLRKIRKDAKNKTIYFPNSLEEISGDLFIDVPIKGVIFNEGLKGIYDGNWLTKLKSLIIPSTLERISITAFQVASTESITFNISQNNASVLNKDFLLEIFNYFQNFGWELNEEKNKIMPPKELNDIVIHLNEINEKIYIHLKDLSFDYDSQKDGTDIKEVYVINLIKYIYYILTQIRKRYDLMQKVLPFEERIEISHNIPGFLKDLEIIDKKLQKYHDIHISELNDIKAILEEPKNSMGFTSENEHDFANEIAPLEPKIRLFNYYGKLDRSLVNYFYKLKFLYLTKADVVYPFVTDTMDDVEISSYQSFIEDTYYHLKNNSPFADEQYSDNTTSAIKGLIEKIIKNGKDTINSEEILNDLYLLNVFLALGDFKRLITFAKSFKIKPEYKDPSYAFAFEETMPFSTVCLIEYYISIYAKEKKIEITRGAYNIPDDLLKLFHLIYINYEAKDYYFIPEGITSIGSINSLGSTDFYKAIMNGLVDDSEGKNIVTPNSLRALRDDFLILPCKTLTLNEGLQELDLAVFKNVESTSLTIPSTVKTIDYIYFPHPKFTEIIFNNLDFENINILRQILFSCLSFEKLSSGKIRGVLPFKLVFHYDNSEDDLIIGPYLDVLSLDVYSFITKNQLMKKTMNDIEEAIKRLNGMARKRTE